MMKPYYKWILQSERWAHCVDYGSPVTAWKPVMFEIRKRCTDLNDLQLSRIWNKYRHDGGNLMVLDETLFNSLKENILNNC